MLVRNFQRKFLGTPTVQIVPFNTLQTTFNEFLTCLYKVFCTKCFVNNYFLTGPDLRMVIARNNEFADDHCLPNLW